MNTATLAVLLVTLAGHGPLDCPDLGAHNVPLRIEAGPALCCHWAANAPAWHLVVPPHGEPIRHAGFTRRAYRELPIFLLRYECTGLVLFPVRIAEVRTLGAISDVRESICG